MQYEYIRLLEQEYNQYCVHGFAVEFVKMHNVRFVMHDNLYLYI